MRGIGKPVTTSWRVRATVLATVVASCALAPAAEARRVHGHWVTAAPPVPYRYEPTPGDPTVGDISVIGSSTWQGTFDGVTQVYADARTNLVTGDSSGTIDETFTGTSRYGDVGSLHFLERFTLDGETGAFHLVARIVSGAGDFLGSRGRLVFNGTTAFTGQGAGKYFGRWRKPG